MLAQSDYQWIMHRFPRIILRRSFTGRFWCFIGGKVTDGPSVRTFLQSQSASNGGGGVYNYVDCRVDGSRAVARMCIRKLMNWLQSQRLSVCHARTGNSSLTIPQASALLS